MKKKFKSFKRFFNENTLSTNTLGNVNIPRADGKGIFSDDVYAPGDARNLFGYDKKKKKFPLYRRTFSELLSTTKKVKNIKKPT